MEIRVPDWRNKELSIEQVIEKYPDVSKFVILKTDLQRRGYILSDAAKKAYENGNYQRNEESIFNAETTSDPTGLMLRDGTSVVGGYKSNFQIRDPYVIDYTNGKFVVIDQDRAYEEVDFWKQPDFATKKTSKGTLMSEVLYNRPQRLDCSMNRVCHFWDNPGEGCKYCIVGINGINACKKSNIPALYDYDDIAEAVAEAVKEKGRYTMLCVTAGSILSGKELFDDEVDEYIKLFKKLQPVFHTTQLKVQLIGSAYNRRQLERLKEETGIISYTSDIELLNKEAFEWICPGKAKYVGYEEWKHRLYEAVEVFGRGNVNTGTVGGVELAQPNGFKTEKEGLAATLAEAEELAKHGVSAVYCVWGVDGSIFKNQVPPSLDYYVALAKGFNDLREKYELETYFDDYRRCGNHPASDLARI